MGFFQQIRRGKRVSGRHQREISIQMQQQQMRFDYLRGVAQEYGVLVDHGEIAAFQPDTFLHGIEHDRITAQQRRMLITKARQVIFAAAAQRHRTPHHQAVGGHDRAVAGPHRAGADGVGVMPPVAVAAQLVGEGRVAAQDGIGCHPLGIGGEQRVAGLQPRRKDARFACGGNRGGQRALHLHHVGTAGLEQADQPGLLLAAAAMSAS